MANTTREICTCARCGQWFRDGEPRTRLYVAEDPTGELGLSGTFHDECAMPVWAFVTPKVAASVALQ